MAAVNVKISSTVQFRNMEFPCESAVTCYSRRPNAQTDRQDKAG